MDPAIKNRPMTQTELKKLGVPIKIVYTQEGQSDDEAISEEAASHVEDGSEVYLVVMPKGEKLPDDKEEKLKGYSVNNTYEKEKEDDAPKDNEEVGEKKNTTAEVNKMIEKLDVPEQKDDVIDPTAILNVQKATDNYLQGNFDYAISTKTIDATTFMTLDGNGMGYESHTIRQEGAIPNNYAFWVRRLGNRKAGDKIDMHLETVDMSLSHARKPKTVYIAPGKKDVDLKFSKQSALVVDNGLPEIIKGIQEGLMTSEYRNGEGPEVRRRRAPELDDVILTLTNSSDSDQVPYAYGSRIINRSFPVLRDRQVYDLAMQIADIDQECVVNEDYYNPIFEALQSTDKQIEKPDADYLAHRHEYYDVKHELHNPGMVTDFLFHPRNAEFAGKITRKQVEDAVFKGAVLPLSNVGETATDFAISLGMSVTTVSLNGRLANLASASSASRFLHDYLSSMLHTDIWMRYPLVSSPRMYSQFDLGIFMDALFHPLMLTPLQVDFDNIRALRNYVYFFLCRPIFDVVDVLDDGDSDTDMLHGFLTNPPQGMPADKRRLFGEMRRYFGPADYRQLGLDSRRAQHVAIPPGTTSLLESPNGGFRESAVQGVLDEYIHRPTEALQYAGAIRNGKPAGVMLNGTEPTVGNKPRVGIWDKAIAFSNAFYTVAGDPAMRRVMAAVDGNTLQSCASVMKKTLETRAVGFQHRINEMNYFVKYMGKFGFVSPKSIMGALNYDIERSPAYKEIQTGSIFSAVALTPITDLRKVVLPDAQQIIDGLSAYSNIEEFLVMKLLVKEAYSPETLQAVAEYDRPIKRADNTSKELLKKAFTLYGSGSAVVNALKEQIEAVTYDYIDNWYFPDDAEVEAVALQHTMYRKFTLYSEYFENNLVPYGIIPNFWLSKQEPDEDIDETTNGGLTRATQYRAIRRVNFKSDDIIPTERYDAEQFYNRYVQGEDIDAMFKHIQKLRRGEAHVLVEIPVNWSISEMSVGGPSELTSAASFPIKWSRESAASVKAENVTFEFWPSFTVTGERAHDEKYMFLAPKFARPTINPVLTIDDRFTTMEDLIKSEDEGGHLCRIANIPERFKTLRPKRTYYNPMMYDTTNY